MIQAPKKCKTWETRRNNLAYEKSFASHPKAKLVDLEHPNNKGIDLTKISCGSNTPLTLKCDCCPHHYIQSPKAMTRKKKCVWRESEKRFKNDGPAGCPYCSHQKLCDDESCKMCHDNSCASVPWLSRSWSPNNKSTARQTFKSNNDDTEVECCVCLHTFTTKPGNVKNDGGCRFCANQERCKNPNCDVCNKKKFSIHPKAIHWSENNEDTPDDVAICSHLRRLFDCADCGHKDIPMIISNITSKNQWCPYCSIPRKKLCGKSDCNHCFENSIASLPQSVYWDYEKNGDVKPYQVMRSTDTKYYLKCPQGCKVYMSGSSLCAGCFCGTCYKKTEKKLKKRLSEHYPDLIHNFGADWCRNNETKQKRILPFDFCIEEKRVIIELDGSQHFEDVKYFRSSFVEQHERDLFKQTKANENDYRVIRLKQDDVWKDKYDWLTELLDNIEEDTKHNIFMCKNNEYDFFIKSMETITSEGLCQPCSSS